MDRRLSQNFFKLNFNEKDTGVDIDIIVKPDMRSCARTTSSFGAGDHDAFALKCASDGTLIWENTWGGEDEDNAGGVTYCACAHAVYVVGCTFSFAPRTLNDVIGIETTPSSLETTPSGVETIPSGELSQGNGDARVKNEKIFS